MELLNTYCISFFLPIIILSNIFNRILQIRAHPNTLLFFFHYVLGLTFRLESPPPQVLPFGNELITKQEAVEMISDLKQYCK